MQLDNLKLFEIFAASVLAHLYENFPIRIELRAEEIAQQCIDEPTDQDERDQVNKIASSTIAYLINEGFVRSAEHPEGPRRVEFGRTPPTMYFGLRLSERGLQLLDAIPAVVDKEADRRSPGERLADAVEGGHWKLASDAIREVMRIAGRRAQ